MPALNFYLFLPIVSDAYRQIISNAQSSIEPPPHSLNAGPKNLSPSHLGAAYQNTNSQNDNAPKHDLKYRLKKRSVHKASADKGDCP